MSSYPYTAYNPNLENWENRRRFHYEHQYADSKTYQSTTQYNSQNYLNSNTNYFGNYGSTNSEPVEPEPEPEEDIDPDMLKMGRNFRLTTFRYDLERFDRTILEYLVDTHNLDLQVDELLMAKRQTYASLIDELQPIQGVIPFLNQVADTFRLALTTSASRRNKDLAFGKFHLNPFFEVVITSDDITRPKPDPEPYLVTTKKLDLPADNCIVIEDSVNGVHSAAAAGCVVIGITTGFDEDALKTAGAHWVIDSYSELAALI